jgi:outer membrane lipoprotein carrier protein
MRFPPALTLVAILCLSLMAICVIVPALSPRTVHAARKTASRIDPYALAPRAQAADLDSVINAIQKKYSHMQGIGADFVQAYNGPDGHATREGGRLLLKRPGKARWDYDYPEKKVFLSDGKSVYFFVYGDRQATRAAVKESRDPQIPFLFLLGRGNLRREFSRIELINSDPVLGPGNLLLRLVPRRAPEEFKQLQAEIDPSTMEVRRLVILQRNGARMDFQLKNIRDNFVAPDSQFAFVPPPGVKIVQAQGSG